MMRAIRNRSRSVRARRRCCMIVISSPPQKAAFPAALNQACGTPAPPTPLHSALVPALAQRAEALPRATMLLPVQSTSFASGILARSFRDPSLRTTQSRPETTSTIAAILMESHHSSTSSPRSFSPRTKYRFPTRCGRFHSALRHSSINIGILHVARTIIPNLVPLRKPYGQRRDHINDLEIPVQPLICSPPIFWLCEKASGRPYPAALVWLSEREFKKKKKSGGKKNENKHE